MIYSSRHSQKLVLAVPANDVAINEYLDEIAAYEGHYGDRETPMAMEQVRRFEKAVHAYREAYYKFDGEILCDWSILTNPITFEQHLGLRVCVVTPDRRAFIRRLNLGGNFDTTLLEQLNRR
jgi:hypothetical protein